MRTYDLMAVFSAHEDLFLQGSTAVRALLQENDAVIAREDHIGERELAYPLKKQKRGRYLLFIVQCEPGKVRELDHKLRLRHDLLTHLFVRVDS